MSNIGPDGERETAGVGEEETAIVSITEQGQATIPKHFREELGLSAPGKVQFRKTERGEIVVEVPSSFSEFRGSLETGEQSATALLREERKRDRQREEERLESRFLE